MSNVATTATQGRFHIDTPLLTRIGGGIFFCLIGWLIYRGWMLRSEHYLTAEKGMGYALGIIGASMMLALLLYPLRKNLRLMRNWGPVRIWFRMHMIFGLLGPSLILFHANFGLGSPNSSIALVCMLLVASSGLIGRFLYTRIHYGLYGRKATLQELGDIAQHTRGKLSWLDNSSEEFTQHLKSMEQLAIRPASGLLHSAYRILQFTATGWWHRRNLRRLATQSLNAAACKQQWTKATQQEQQKLVRNYLRTYFITVRKVLGFNFYERMFSLWHIAHLPFFFMMLLSGVIHVIAVHMY